VAEPRAQEQPRERAQPKTQEQPKQEVAKVPARPRFEDPCANPALVGAGRNPRAVCRDTLPGDKRGPLLVVIPAGGPFKTPVAFGRYEITIRDYNTYCESSGQCAPLAADDDTLPLTGVSADQAEAFVAWLGVSSGARYRIPTAQEWEYAANANGAQPDPDWNCQLRMNGDLIKGLNLQKVTTGKPNGWGLMNYVGNAQEWVHSGSSWSARGGAYTDDYNHCSIKLQVSHSGQPDKVTGFRILRELG
jgi:hypothetical protein